MLLLRLEPPRPGQVGRSGTGAPWCAGEARPPRVTQRRPAEDTWASEPAQGATRLAHHPATPGPAPGGSPES